MGAACHRNSEAVGAVHPQLFIGLVTVGAVVLSKLGVVGHKRKLNGRKHFNEKSSSCIGSAAHLADKRFLMLPQRYFFT